MRKHSGILVGICLSFLGLAGAAFAQLDRGTITGVVTDPTGAVVVAASITAVHLDTNTSAKAVTTGTGNYVLPALLIGRYQVQVEAPGFKRALRDGVVISAAATVRLDVSLDVGSTAESVEVVSQASPLETETTRVATTINNKLVDELPLVVAGRIRNVFNLVTLAPEAKTANNYRIGGGQGAGWDMLMDGSSITVASAVKQTDRAQLTSVPVDAISEFTVESSGMKAEFGRAAGVISFATKSGTSQFHGNAFEYLRNDALDARGFFSDARPILRQHDFGATFGGPFIIPRIYNGRNKTFFFASYEGFRSREGDTVSFFTIPLPEMYQGDFSRWVRTSGSVGALIPIYDPATTNPSGSGYVRTPFAGNQIPAARFSTFAKNYIALRPAEMVPNLSGPTQNYTRQQGSVTYPWDKGTVRMDHQLSAKDSITFFFMRGLNADAMGPEGVPGLPFPFMTGPPLWDRTVTYGKFGWNRMVTPHTLNTLRYNKQKAMAFIYGASCSYSENNWGSKLGVKNVPGPDRCIPPVSMSAYTTWAGLADAGWGRDDGWDWSISNDLSQVRGSHTLKGGFYYSRNDWAGGGQGTPNGQYGFTQLATSIPSDQSNNTGNAFASFLLGYTSSAGLQTPRRQVYHWKHFGGYFQDDWRVTRNVTINLGLRYDFTFGLTGGAFTSVMKDAKDTIGTVVAGLEPGYSNFDPKLGNPAAGGLPGAVVFTGKGPGRTGSAAAFPSWPWAFQPRLGIAYAIRPGTVLRSSVGRNYQDSKTPGGTAHFDGFIGTLSWNSNDLSVLDFPMMLDNGMPPWQQPPYLQPDVKNEMTLNWWDPRDAGRSSEFWSWNFDIQQQVAPSTVVTARYSGSRGLHLISSLQRINQLPPSSLTTYGPTLLRAGITSAAARAAGIPIPYPGFNSTVQRALQPFPQYMAISVGLEHLGDSTYHAMVLMLDRRFSSGFTMLASYSLSKMFSNAEAVTGGATAMDTYNLALDKGLSGDDQTHVLRASFSYDFPFGKGKRFASSGLVTHVVGGWSISATTDYASGTPQTVGSGFSLPYGGGNRVFADSYDNWRAPVSGDKFDPFQDLWWNRSAFNQVPQAVLDTLLGNTTVNNPKTRSPWFLNENVSLAKNIAVTEKLRVMFRFEAFNIFNRVRFGGATNTLNSQTFGLVRSQSNDPRKMQAALKFYF